MEKVDGKAIAKLGLFIALEVICTRFLAIETQFIRVSVSFIVLMMMGSLFGPWLAGIGGIVGDVIGMLLAPKAPFFPGFTLNAFLLPFIYGLFFYKKEFTLKRNILAQLTVTVVINLLLTPLWLQIMYKIPVIEMMPVRLLKEAISLPIQVVMSQYVMSQAVVANRIKAI